MNIYSTMQDLDDAISAIGGLSAEQYVFNGRRKTISSRPLIVKTPKGTPRVVAELANDLYTSFYTKTGPLPPILRDDTSMHAFCARLSEANQAAGLESAGWRRVRAAGSQVLVEDGSGNRRVVPSSVFVGGEDGDGLLRRAKDSYKRESTFYYALPDVDPPGADYSTAVRTYFTVCPQGAPALVRAVSSSFNENGVPYRFKILKDPLMYHRADRSVLYICPENWDAAVPCILDVWRHTRRYLLDKKPAFTKRLAPGLSLAESPRGLPGDSFGSHRCRLIARGAWEASERGANVRDQILEVLHMEGIDPEYLYLKGGNNDPY